MNEPFDAADAHGDHRIAEFRASGRFITIRAMRGSGRSTTMVSYAVMVLTLLSVTVQRFSRLPVGQENL